MGNKAAGGPFQLEHAEGPVFHVGAMSGNDSHDEGCASVAVPPSGAAEGSDGSGDDERAYVSPAEVEEAEAVVVAASEERAYDAVNFTRNNSQSSMGNNRPPGSPAEAIAVGEPMPAPIPTPVAEERPAEPVPPPPRAPAMPAAAAVSVSPPRAPGGNDLQLPPLNDPNPLPGSEEAARLSARGSPSSAEGRDQKGAQ